MAHPYNDKEAGIIHLRVGNNDSCLCGLPSGYTTNHTIKPVKEKYGLTCEGCIAELKELRAHQ